MLAAFAIGLAMLGARAGETMQLHALQQSAPALYTLYGKYPSLHPVFERYAANQGFRRPAESLATVVHELIHVDSAAHEGFFVDGTYYEPYLRRDAWPSLTLAQVLPYLTEQERQGPIAGIYARSAPGNGLGNLVDEMNAYGHVLPFVCRLEAESCGKQVTNLLGFLSLTEGYLRTLRTGQPAQFQRFAQNRQARGAFTLIVQRAWAALRASGVSAAQIPAQESSYLMALPR